VYVTGTEDTPRSADPLASRLEFEMLISDISSRFVNLPSSEVDREIEDVQHRVCEVLGVDLSALWEEAVAGGPLTLTHFYSSQEDLLPPMRGMSAGEYFPWLQQEMLAGRAVVASSLEELPEAAALDRQNLRLFGVKSNLTVPLLVGGASNVGALGFNTTRSEREWPDIVVKRLQLVAQVFANALARKRADEALRESEERLSLAADSADAGLWVLDYATRVFWVTARTRSIFGFSPDESVTIERFEAVIHPDDRGLVREAIARPALAAGGPAIVEYRITLPGQAEERWVSSRGRPRPKPTGEPDRLMGVSIDITERKRAEQALRASEARLASGAELAGLAFYDVDFDAGTMYSDDRLRELCGVPADQVAGLGVLDFWMEHVHPDDSPRVVELRRQMHRGEQERLSIEYRYLHPGGGERWIQHLAGAAARDAGGRAVRTYGVIRDVTDRKRAEEEARELSRRLISAQEEERALLARELHDDVSQRLAVLAIEVGRAELNAADGEQAEAMQAVREGLVSLSEDVHTLAYQLHPSVLEELGLAEALRAECGRRARTGELDVSADLGPLPHALTMDSALCLFRVAQEALGNVARHARARHATVILRQAGDGLLLAVSDDGLGFDPERSGEGMHLGLASMNERVRLVRGTLDIESAPGQGTKVIAWVPVEEDGAT
jgi:PAS domain S-box-containing protein